MKKFLSMLLVLTMVLAIAGGAMAACKFKKGDWVEFKCDANAYNAAKSSKKTNNVVQKGSHAQVMCVSGDYVKLRVNEASKIDKWFKASDLKSAKKENKWTWVVWAKGGKGMSTRDWSLPIYTNPYLKNCYVKASGHTNLRKTPSLHCKSQAVVEKCALLKLTGRIAMDDRMVLWYEVCYKGKKLWLSTNFVMRSSLGGVKFFDKDGKRIDPYA
jgi:hypothetical protein